jgi:uncharacterized protein YgbK (DUF1537 family)
LNPRFVQIIADDLTGALDAAAPFATPHRPVRLLLEDGDVADRDRLAGFTISSESRDLDAEAGDAAVTRAFERLARVGVPGDRAPLRFAKVDSVLRGRPVAETLLRMRLWDVPRCLFAPAFPAMGRRTVAGRHETRADGAWQPAPVHDLVAAFQAAGAMAAQIEPGAARFERQEEVIVGNASAFAHLAGHVKALADRSPIVWAGSRGLAEALVGTTTPCPMPALAAVVAGTSHPATRRQVETAKAAGVFEQMTLIDPVPHAEDATATRARVGEAVAGLDLPLPGHALLVVGGDTLAAVLRAVGARRLDCAGEVAPGVALSYIGGGRLDGVALVTKSGGFGAPGLLVELAG